jgi:preprotein translocase subunit SecF
MIISGIVLIPGVWSLIQNGFKQSIDFTGGTIFEFRLSKDVPLQDIQKTLEAQKIPIVSIQKTDRNSILLRSKPVEDKIISAIPFVLNDEKEATATVLRNESVGPVLGKELLQKTLTASLFAAIIMLSYIAYAFKNIKYGVTAIIALIHDVLVVLGCFSLFGKFLGIEIDTLFVTAVLTTMSFSVHDTIVVYDRIREYGKRHHSVSFDELADTALNETMGRSLANSFTIMFMLLALVLMGGDTVKWFSVALLIGTITGTYSSPFVATMGLVVWERFNVKRKQKNVK